MRTPAALFLVFATCVLAGCSIRFGPGFSMHDKAYFAEKPHIVVRTNTYSLRWQYGASTFYFQPDSKIVDGQLLFSLQATTSTGSVSGHYDEVPITDPKQIEALKNGGAYWLEPDGRKIRLEVSEM